MDFSREGCIDRCLTSDRNPAKLVLALYRDAKDYVVTNLTGDEIVCLGTTVLSGGWTVEIQSVPGELILGDIYEFTPTRPRSRKYHWTSFARKIERRAELWYNQEN